MLEGVWLVFLSLFADIKNHCSASNTIQARVVEQKARLITLSLQTLVSRLWKISMVGVVSAIC